MYTFVYIYACPRPCNLIYVCEHIVTRTRTPHYSILSGAKNVLDMHSKQSGSNFLKLKALGELGFKGLAGGRASTPVDSGAASSSTPQPRTAAKPVAQQKPENRIGIRRTRLHAVTAGEGGATPQPIPSSSSLVATAATASLVGGSGSSAARPHMAPIPEEEQHTTTAAPGEAGGGSAGKARKGRVGQEAAAGTGLGGAGTGLHHASFVAPPVRERKSLKDILAEHSGKGKG